jgi:hypothetical protein
MAEKYQTGNHNKGGAAYNILNLAYENSREGDFLKSKDTEKQVRGLLRSRHIDALSNSGYNLTNGEGRLQVQVPEHPSYNPPGSAHSAMARAGAAVFGDGFAGAPIRKDDKLYGKRVGNSEDAVTTSSYQIPHTGPGGIPKPNAGHGGVVLPIN